MALQPVIEALPVEEWFAIASIAAQTTEKDETQETKKGPHTTSIEPVPVPLAEILEALPKLIEQFLDPWLERTGIGLSNHAATIIDARADTISTQIRAFVDLRPLAEPCGTAGQSCRQSRHRLVTDAVQVAMAASPLLLPTTRWTGNLRLRYLTRFG